MIFLGLFYSGPQSLIQGGHRVITLSKFTQNDHSLDSGLVATEDCFTEEHDVLVLHLLSHLVGVQDARHRHLDFSLLLLRCLQGGLKEGS